MFVQPFAYGTDRYFRRTFIRKAKHASGDAAERYAAQAVLGAKVKGISVAIRQILFQRLCQPSLHNGADDMDDLLRRKVISVRQHGDGGRLLIISAIADTELIHLPIAFCP